MIYAVIITAGILVASSIIYPIYKIIKDGWNTSYTHDNSVDLYNPAIENYDNMIKKHSKAIKEREKMTSKWDSILNTQKEMKKVMKFGVISRMQLILIFFISLGLSNTLLILGNLDRDQFDIPTAIGLVAFLLISISLPIFLGLYIIVKKKLKDIIQQLDEAIEKINEIMANQNPRRREK
ncbi:hypothetical protein [Bartonella schoenbuchensis]|uniref:Uncharacterized protein n=1 Tax=Bartonella schoenbuchensis (strain DSM 13525 / NCTC 13165 / R1) TaxID=687861 RepID=E6YZT3_BARSR|nr:hypothetical protein [Bartonella schoenbuchensis]AQX30835.1 hypothetical protein BscR1v2_009030 [Bartonella schoenbuchensis R1]CBI82371.1 membrane hypothetical protein [Bartonella schoenbuchensis R1]